MRRTWAHKGLGLVATHVGAHAPVNTQPGQTDGLLDGQAIKVTHVILIVMAATTTLALMVMVEHSCCGAVHSSRALRWPQHHGSSLLACLVQCR